MRRCKTPQGTLLRHLLKNTQLPKAQAKAAANGIVNCLIDDGWCIIDEVEIAEMAAIMDSFHSAMLAHEFNQAFEHAKETMQ